MCSATHSTWRECPGGRLLWILFFFNDTATTEIYTLSLHDALPILTGLLVFRPSLARSAATRTSRAWDGSVALVRREIGRSTRLNSSHANISYAVFCLKKKKYSRPSHSRDAPSSPPELLGPRPHCVP